MSASEIRVPDLGDFKDVLIVEVLVAVGDAVAIEQPLLMVESEKATMDIPSSVAGTIVSLEVKPGDKVSSGSVIALFEPNDGLAPAQAAKEEPPAAPASPIDPRAIAPGEEPFDVVVIGGGPGGYSAAFRAADLGQRVAIVERDANLGGVCLNVGCIPSKALLHVAAVREEAERLAEHGVRFGAAEIDLAALRGFKGATVRRLTDGLAQMAKQRKVEHIAGTARFTGANRLVVAMASGSERAVAFRSCIIAAGSSPVSLPFLPDDPRIVDSTGALELPFVPQRMLVIGGGIIGLEMATVYSALGARIDVVEQLDGILGGVDSDLVGIWMKRNRHRFDRVMLSARLEAVTAGPDGLLARFDGGEEEAVYDLILQAAGRRPNGGQLSLEAAGLTDDRGFIAVDERMRTAVPHIYAIGDIVGQPMLAHKAVHQGHIAAENVAGHNAAFDAMVIPSVAYTDPEIAWVGITEDGAKADGRAIDVAKFPWAASGRAIANGADYGLTKLIFSKDTGRILGGGIVGPGAGDLIGEICLAIEMGADAEDIGKTIHPHPTLCETIGLTAEAARGVCTDLPRGLQAALQ